MSENILFTIIDRIETKGWCFKYNGACSTCGMMSVKKELKKYTFEEIIQGFNQIDYNNEPLCIKYITALEKIYSLVTSHHTIYKTKDYSFKVFETLLRTRYPNNYYVDSLINSNSITYWHKWEQKQRQRQNEQMCLAKERKTRLDRVKKLRQEEHLLRGSDYHINLIKKIERLNIKQRVEYLAYDNKHTIKFYPSVLLSEIKTSFNEINTVTLQILLDKILEVKVKIGPWRWVKREIRKVLNES